MTFKGSFPFRSTATTMGKWQRVSTIMSLLLMTFSLFGVCQSSRAESNKSIVEEVEWTWEVRPPKPAAQLPNVLLLGDSITRNYFPQVEKDLIGVANLYLLATSASVGDPRLELQIREFAKIQGVPFRVVHFNNGMHGWGYTEVQYKAAFPQLIQSVKAVAGKQGILIWTSTTPVKVDKPDGPTNLRVDRRNAIALALVQGSPVIVDDQHSLMLNHVDLYADSVHYNDVGSNLMGDQVAESIRAALKR